MRSRHVIAKQSGASGSAVALPIGYAPAGERPARATQPPVGAIMF